MNEMKIVCSARPLVIVLAVVLVMCVVCGTAAAEVRYTYVDTFPTGGDRNVHVTSSLKEALESPDFDVVVVTKDITITDNIVVNGSKTLVSYYPAGTEINANSAYMTIPAGADLTLGTGMNEVNISGANRDAALFLVDGGTLTMKDHVKLYGNNARNGVIKVTGAGYFHMEGGEITQNTLTEWGSAVYIESADLLPPGVRFRMSGGNISSNTARLISGGVYIGNNAEFIMNGGAIYGNTGYTGGGVLVGPGGKFTQNYGTIAENNADRSMGYGGGVSVSMGGVYDMYGGSVNNNSAYIGGGVGLLADGLRYASFTMYDGTIADNFAVLCGGGVMINADEEGSVFTMADGIIHNNSVSADGVGGGVCLMTANASARFTMNSGTLSNNSALVGGGVCLMPFSNTFYNGSYYPGTVEGASFTLNGGTLENNSAEYAPAVYVGGNQTKTPEGRAVYMPTIFTMTGGSIENNLGNKTIYAGAGKFSMSGGEITSNNVSDSLIFLDRVTDYYPELNIGYQAVFSLSGGEIYDNLGNCTYVYNNDSIILMTAGDIWNSDENSTSHAVENFGNFTMSGGEIFGFNTHGVNNSVNFTMEGGVIFENSDEFGGGVNSVGNFIMSGGMISANTANVSGGGINATTLEFYGGTISGNNASDYGGGVFVQSLNMTGGSIYGNSAKFGGAVVFNTTFNMTGGSISANKAATGKGLYLVEGDFYLGGSGFVNEDNDVWVKENNVINVTTPLTSGGVRSITPARDTAQTVVRISDGNNASKYLSNFGLNPDYAKSANQNSLSASGFTITTSHKASPAPTPDNGGNGITYLGDVLYSVAFDYTNDSGITDVYNLKYGSKVERPEDPARSGYRFIGWQNAFGYEWDFENDVIEASIILYAQWERVYSPAIPIATDTPKSPVPAAGIILGMFVLALFISLRKQ